MLARRLLGIAGQTAEVTPAEPETRAEIETNSSEPNSAHLDSGPERSVQRRLGRDRYRRQCAVVNSPGVCHANLCAGLPSTGCSQDSQCPEDGTCVLNGGCNASTYSCDPVTGETICTCEGEWACPCDADCDGADTPGKWFESGGVCVAAADEGSCWTDDDCGEGAACGDVRVCPCGALCIIGTTPGTCQEKENECTSDSDCPSKNCIPGELCLDVCAAGDPSCCFGNTCEELCGEPYAGGCSSDSQCASDQCLMGGACNPSTCSITR
ncbi:MAG: hypothetical protein ACI9OJ_002840 [Myxococcota bacterium]